MPLKERRELLEDRETDIDSAEEIIEEIIPKRQDGPVRKKKVKIIPSWTSIQVKRELRERRRLSDVLSEQSDHLPKYKVFTDSERENEKEEPRKGKKGKKPALTREYRPKRFRQVRLTMNTGEVIEGKVSHIEKGTLNWFFVTNKDKKHRPIDIDEVDEWIYNE